MEPPVTEEIETGGICDKKNCQKNEQTRWKWRHDIDHDDIRQNDKH